MMESSMKEKVCLVTGATSGIGRATAVTLMQMGANTILVGRDREKCEKVLKKAQKINSNAKAEYIIADLSSKRDIRRLADEFNSKYDRLDVLVNNAGAKFVQRSTTVDGYEMSFALNHLAYFLLTHLMLDRLKATGRSRIVNVSSGAHGGAVIDFEDLQSEKGYVGKAAYNRSKLANLLFTYELSRKLDGTGITVNAVAPGGVITNFCRNNGWVSWSKHVLAHILARNLIGPKKASETIIYLCTSPDVEGVSGQYFFDKRLIKSSRESYDEQSAKRLWEESLKLVE